MFICDVCLEDTYNVTELTSSLYKKVDITVCPECLVKFHKAYDKYVKINRVVAHPT